MELKPEACISKVKDLDLLSWVISAGVLLLNFLIVMPLIVTVQEFPPSPLLALTLTSSPKLSLMLSASQLELEPTSSPFVIMVTSTVSFLWISNSKASEMSLDEDAAEAVGARPRLARTMRMAGTTATRRRGTDGSLIAPSLRVIVDTEKSESDRRHGGARPTGRPVRGGRPAGPGGVGAADSVQYCPSGLWGC